MKRFKIGSPVKFKKSKYPTKKKLVGKYCVLEPVNVKKHAKDLYENFSIDKDWNKIKKGYQAFLKPSNFKNFKQIKKLKF